MLAQTYTGQSESLLERFGAYPAMLLLAALALGVAALCRRQPKFNLCAGVGLLSIAVLAIGCTAWRIQEMTSSLGYHGVADPSQLAMDAGYAWRAAGAVLPVCGFAGVLLTIACLVTKPDEKG